MKTETKAMKRTRELNDHYNVLRRLALACGAKSPDGKKLSLALLKLEREAHKRAEDYCNGVIDSDHWDKIEERISGEVQALFNNNLKGFFVNGDPRGYALKIESEVNALDYAKIGLVRDMGGYGLLSPEIK